MVNFYARVAEAAARFPDHIALEVQRPDRIDALTYRDLTAAAGRFTAWLQAAGIERGDRCAILADNDATWVAAYLGILRIGAVAVPLDTAYKPPQVHVVLSSCGARVLFTTPRYLETANRAGDLAGTARPMLFLLNGSADGVPDAAALERTGDPPPVADVAASDAAVLLYTSGTTSDPKGVILTHANLDAERLAAFAVVDVDETDAILGVLPLFHALAQMANLLLPLTVGARVVFLEEVNSTALVQALQDRGITMFACVPQFFYLIHQRVKAESSRAGAVRRRAFQVLLRTNGWLRDTFRWNPGRRWFARVHRVLGTRMRILVTGGSKFDPAIGRDLYDLGFTLLNAYGLTETSGGATMARPGDRFTPAVGQAFPSVEIRIAPRDHTAEADAEDGEILIRGPVVMAGYFNRPDATREALQDGWLHTGDLGYLDAEGRLYLTGRKKEIIVLSSGKNLYPEEIEAHYRQSPFIKELCVLGLTRPGEPSAERLHAVVVPDDQAMRARGVVNVGDLLRFELEGLSVRLPAHKRILSYDVWLEPLPRTSTNKLKRHEIERRVRERAAHRAADDESPLPALSDDERAWLADAGNAAALKAVADRLHLPRLRPGANLELDLGLDSMERVEMLTALEQQHATRVSPEARATIFTVRHLVDRVRAGEAAGEGGAQSTPWETILDQPPDRALIDQLQKPKTAIAIVFRVVLSLAALLARGVFRFRVSGREHLPSRGPFIISPNHQSYLDGFLLAAALPLATLRSLFFVGAAEYFETPTMAGLARLVNIVPIDPDANLVTAMQAGAAGLRLGRVLILFPEGERSIDGEIKSFRKGAAILASYLNAPIVPVAIDGLFDVWPRGRSFNWRALLPWRITPVRLRFGAPITVNRGEYTEGTAALKRAVADMIDAFRRERNESAKPVGQAKA
jgi:long-chain acyl-CoA synthetase